jgi:peptide/nickel transport system substrate-binding protein
MTMRRPLVSLAMLIAGAALFFAAFSHAGGSARIRDGGTFRISLQAANFDYVDPALSYSWILLDATCARLMNHTDKPPPEGLRLVPEVAAAFPRVSGDGKTYRFTLRPGLRFSDGTPVHASAFAHAINRILTKGIGSPAEQYVEDIVGAGSVRAGKTATAAGVVADGNRLVVKFTRPHFDFAEQTAMPFFCAVPPTLPSDPEGVPTFPGSGPYYVSEYVRNQRIVLERNRFYGGTRPHHVDRYVVDLRAKTPQEVFGRIEQGQADWGSVAPGFLYFDPAQGLIRKYGVNRSQFFVKPGLALRGYYLNVSRPLFHDNLALRRAVNFAVDRPAIVSRGGLFSSLAGRPTDQYLPPSMPGFRDAHLYPLDGPDLGKARRLARGHLRGGEAVLWTPDLPPAVAAAQVVKQNLKQVGLEVEIKALPREAFFREAAKPNAPFDIALGNWVADFVDPYQYINVLFDGRSILGVNIAHFDLPKYNALMRRAGRLHGEQRSRSYGQLDVQLARDGVPMIAVAFDTDATLVSKRVGCILLRPASNGLAGLDLTAACLK